MPLLDVIATGIGVEGTGAINSHLVADRIFGAILQNIEVFKLLSRTSKERAIQRGRLELGKRLEVSIPQEMVTEIEKLVFDRRIRIRSQNQNCRSAARVQQEGGGGYCPSQTKVFQLKMLQI